MSGELFAIDDPLTKARLNAKTILISATEPTGADVAAGMVWIDTSGADAAFKVRNKANTAWTEIFTASLKYTLSMMQEVMGLADLSNVAITSPVTDHVLKYNGTSWVNGVAPASGLSELSKTETSADGNISLSFTAKEMMMIFFAVKLKAFGTGTTHVRMKFNNDGGTDYEYKSSTNGNVDGSSSNQTSVTLTGSSQISQNNYVAGVVFIYRNVATKNKLFRVLSQQGSDGDNVPSARVELTGLFNDTAVQITSIQFEADAGKEPAAGSMVYVLGTDV